MISPTDRFFYITYPWFTELNHFVTNCANGVIVLLKTETLFILGTVLTKLVLDNQSALKQEFHGVVQCGSANPVAVVFHSDVKGFYVEMSGMTVYFFQNCKPFRSFSVICPAKILSKNLLYSLITVNFLLIVQISFHDEKFL
ncbi:hypothetical protein SDC9_62861 [bioreactor metagenome]|uniref:Uncharacterized protein n=1 Tax=bioreactor metagenome TaxID=1076179 RepID=A0A644XJX2_9ZZZZ